MTTIETEQFDIIGVAAGGSAETSRLRLPPEYAAALEKFYAARRCRAIGAHAESTRLLTEAFSSLESIMAEVSTPYEFSAVAETAVNCSLEAGQYLHAAELASLAIDRLNEMRDIRLVMELARLELLARLLSALGQGWSVDWLKVACEDNIDLILTRNDKCAEIVIAEIVLDEDATSPHEIGTTTACVLRLIVPTTNEGCVEAARRISEWASFPSSRYD